MFNSFPTISLLYIYNSFIAKGANMSKKLSLSELNVESFITTESGNVKGGITGNNTGCPTNNTCAMTQQKGCLQTNNAECWHSEYQPACDPKTQNPRNCAIEIETVKF